MYTVVEVNYSLLQEIAALRQGILTCEGELRAVSSPAYTAKDRDRALAEQSVSTRVWGPPQSKQGILNMRNQEEENNEEDVKWCGVEGVGAGLWIRIRLDPH